MLRFVYYELKAMFRYSSGAKRRRVSAIVLLALPIYFFFLLSFTLPILKDIRGFLYRYSIPRLLFLSSVLTSGGIAINIGRVSRKARELIYSSPISDTRLFLSLFLVVLVNSLPAIAVFPEVAYFISSYRGLFIATVFALIGSLIGFSTFAPARRTRDLVPHFLVLLSLAAIPYYKPERFYAINDLFLGKIYLENALLGAFIGLLAIPSYLYGKKHIRDVLVRMETISRLGSLSRVSPLRLSILYALRYPSVLYMILIPPIVIAINVILGSSIALEAILGGVLPVIGAMISTVVIFGLSRELGRRELRLSAPKDYYPFRVRYNITVFMLIASSIAVGLSEYPNIINMIYYALSSLGLFFLVAGATLYYSVGAAKPIKGSLQDAFRAPLMKQLLVGMILSIVVGISSGILLFLLSKSLSLLLSLAYISIGRLISRSAERRFLRKARERENTYVFPLLLE